MCADCEVCLSVIRIREPRISPVLSSPFGAILHPPSISWCLIRQGGSASRGNKGSDSFLFLPHLFSKSISVAGDLPLSSYGGASFLFLFPPPIINNNSYYVFSLFVGKCIQRERLLRQLFSFPCQCYFAKVCCAYLYLRGLFLKP